MKLYLTYKVWQNSLTKFQRIWLTFMPLAVLAAGIAAGDTWLNLTIGVIGAIYVSVYSTGARSNFLLGILYVSLYTFICLQNRIMLDALQNVILIPIYIASYIHWGNANVRPKNLSKRNATMLAGSALLVLLLLFALSKSLRGNYSFLDSLNTTMTMYAMITGYYGLSIAWAAWSINNIASALVFGLALMTPTGSAAVFVMKMLFLINGVIGYYNFKKIGERN